jgi:hypothetical protein
VAKYQDVDLVRLGETKELADAIRKISDGFGALLQSGLNERAIVLLLHDCTGVGKREIASVLEAIPRLKEHYCDRKSAKD